MTVATVAVCVPTIPQRRDLLTRAFASVQRQVVRDGVRVVCQVAVDVDGEGAAATRNRAWRDVDPDAEWLAFLDDDDELYSDHVQRCLDHAVETGADLVYPWFHIVDAAGGDVTHNDPLRAPVDGHYVTPFGVPFDDALRTELLTRNNFIPVTVLVRRSLVADVGGFPIPGSPEWGDDCCEDWGLWRRLLNAGATFAHLPERTWAWHWHGNNTSGRPWRR